MKLHRLRQTPGASMGRALGEFEKDFTYPLGANQRFHISHGNDYLAFFSAMGAAEVLVSERGGEVVGTLARVQRSLECHVDGTCSHVSAHYLCDLKVRPSARGSRALPQLISETKRAIEASDTHACYAIVMNGTGRLPTDYTGRLGVPRFEALGEIVVVRLSSGPTWDKGISDQYSVIGPRPSLATRQRSEARKTAFGITSPGYRPVGGQSALRSQMLPMKLATADGLAYGTLEDTQRGKRLFLDTGEELLSGHLSGFAYKDPAAGAALLEGAVAHASVNLLPAVFVAVPRESWERELRPCIRGQQFTEAGATVYGCGLRAGSDWWIDTAEI